MQRTQREINDAIIDEVLITGTANIARPTLKSSRALRSNIRDIFRNFVTTVMMKAQCPCM